MEKEKNVKTKHEKIANAKIAKKFEKLNKKDEEIKALKKHLKNKGFEPKDDEKNYHGFESTHEKDDRKATVSLVIQDYAKPKGKDGACVGQVAIKTDERTEIYTFSLIAPDGDYKKAKEHKVNKKNLEVEEAESWWSCVQNYLVNHFTGDVWAVINNCKASCTFWIFFSWSCFLTCISVKIPLLYVAANACCGCNCGWWCAWFSGCCYQ